MHVVMNLLFTYTCKEHNHTTTHEITYKYESILIRLY